MSELSMASRGPWELIASANKFQKAVRTDYIVHKGKRMRADLVKPRYGDGWWHWEGTGVPIRKATSGEIDGHTDWRPYAV